MSDNHGTGSGNARPGQAGGHSGGTDGSGAIATLKAALAGPAALAAGGLVRGVATPTGQVAAVIQRGAFELAGFADATGGVWSRVDEGRKPAAGLCKSCLEAAAAAGSSLVVRE
jgi:hypothetical protein